MQPLVSAVKIHQTASLLSRRAEVFTCRSQKGLAAVVYIKNVVSLALQCSGRNRRHAASDNQNHKSETSGRTVEQKAADAARVKQTKRRNENSKVKKNEKQTIAAAVRLRKEQNVEGNCERSQEEAGMRKKFGGEDAGRERRARKVSLAAWVSLGCVPPLLVPEDRRRS